MWEGLHNYVYNVQRLYCYSSELGKCDVVSSCDCTFEFHQPRHERYLGMWVDDVKCGPGMVVSSSGTYCEATFANGAIAVSSHDTHCVF